MASSSAYALGVWTTWMMLNTENLGFGPYVGDGSSVVGLIHVDDAVSLMLLVFKRIMETMDTNQPEDVYQNSYNGITKVHPAKKVALAIAEVQARRGKISTPTIKSIPYEEAGITARYNAGNTIVEAHNAKPLGWQPTGPDLYTVLEQLH